MNYFSQLSDDQLIDMARRQDQNVTPWSGNELAIELARRYERLRDCIRQAIDRLEDNPPPKQGARHES